MAEYNGLEPTDTSADVQDIFEGISFDTQDSSAESVPFLNPFGPQDSEQGLEEEVRANEAAPQIPSQYIDPQLLSNDYNAPASATVEQQPLENYPTDPLDANPTLNFMNGNVGYNAPYPPASHFVPSGFPPNAFPYQYPPQTNFQYPGYGNGYPVQNTNGYPVYMMQYPPPAPTYPPPIDPTYPPPINPTYPPPIDPTYLTSEALPQTTPGMTLPVLGNPPMPQVIPTAERIRASFDSSMVDRRLHRAQKSRVPSPIVVYHTPPLKRPVRGPNGEVLKNDRLPRVTRKNQPRPNPREWYGPPLSPPDSWGPKDKNDRPTFKYTEYGELERGKTYSHKEMRWYLYGPKANEDFELPRPLPNAPEIKGKSRQGLTIWIGWVSPQSNDRYPHGSQSQRCRFEDCPDPNHTIRTGFPRVTFDERTNLDGEAIDPFHNAGYAHLYCFERHFDLVQAYNHLDIRADYRDFKREENLGKLSRQFPEINNEIDIWWKKEAPKYLEFGKHRDRSYEHTLSFRLVTHMLEHSSEGRVKMREIRAGADMSKHRGDLVEQLFLKDCMAEGLVDENGDAVPGAHELLAEARKRGKRKRRVDPRRLETPTFPARCGFTPATDYIPAPKASPASFQTSHGVSPTAPTNRNQAISVASTHKPGAATPSSLPHKRDRDEVLAEDQQGGYSNNQEREELPIRKRRLSRTASPQADKEHRPLVNIDECDGLPRSFEPLAWDDYHDAELSDNAAFSMIDDEMPGGKSSKGKNVKRNVETESDDLYDRELGEGDDLFGEADDADD